MILDTEQLYKELGEANVAIAGIEYATLLPLSTEAKAVVTQNLTNFVARRDAIKTSILSAEQLESTGYPSPVDYAGSESINAEIETAVLALSGALRKIPVVASA